MGNFTRRRLGHLTLATLFLLTAAVALSVSLNGRLNLEADYPDPYDECCHLEEGFDELSVNWLIDWSSVQHSVNVLHEVDGVVMVAATPTFAISSDAVLATTDCPELREAVQKMEDSIALRRIDCCLFPAVVIVFTSEVHSFVAWGPNPGTCLGVSLHWVAFCQRCGVQDGAGVWSLPGCGERHF